MAKAKVTLNEIMTAVRELTFDRFIIPAFAIRQMGVNYFLDIDKSFEPIIEPSDPDDAPVEIIKGKLSIYKEVKATNPDTGIEEITKESIVDLPFMSYPTLEDLMNALIEANIIVAYTPYFRGVEPSNVLIRVKARELTEDITTFRRYFFSDEEIKDTISWYYWRVLDIDNVELIKETIEKLVRPSEKHMAIWVSYYLVEKRRLYENAANSVGQSFTDGSDYSGSSEASMGAGTTTTVNIGSVFTVTEDPSQGFFYEDFNRVGSDNVWGDRYSFWYKLMMYLRDLLETTFGDYSLRKDTVMMGNVTLTRELDFRSYFDSYPFTLSPLSRGILSKTP